MAGVEFLTHAWQAWGIQALILLSFTLQVTLLILAEFCRFVNSGVLRFFVWSAYMAADATAIFVLGHMSVTSRSPEQQLVAFWAPFLLMHLGGQDNITAYAIEDNRLWLRHLQTLVFQAAAAGYVIYESFIVGSPALLWWATIIMFVVGVVKYWERVWALKYAAGGNPTANNYRRSQGDSSFMFYGATAADHLPTDQKDTEADLLVAQQTLLVPIRLLKGPQTVRTSCPYRLSLTLRADPGRLYKVVELQLSLMYDAFYTKADVMHSSLFGLGIRMLSAVATVVALVLFHLLIVLGDRHRHGITCYSRVDTAVSYVLLIGAVILETVSLSREMFSSWTSALLMGWYGDDCGMKGSLIHLVRSLSCLRRLVHAANWRRRSSWSRSMGQHNLLEVCTRRTTSRRSKIARWMKVEDWWNTLAYSWFIPVPVSIEKLMMDTVSSHAYCFNSDAWGEAGGMDKGILERSLEKKIIVWHIATSLYMSWYCKKQQAEAEQSKAKVVEALSNYMMFLLASRPHMMPPTASRDVYVDTCYSLTSMGCSSAEDLVNYLRSMDVLGHDVPTGKEYLWVLSCQLGFKLVKEEEQGGQNNMLDLLAQVWLSALFDAGKKCSAYSHAKQLSNGSELITVAALLLKHVEQFRLADEDHKLARWFGHVLIRHRRRGGAIHQ